jgi:hypothetical protein
MKELLRIINFKKNYCMNLPLPRTPNSTSDLPYVFVGDEAFALHKDLLKTFSQKQLTNERMGF